MKNLGFMLFSY